MKLFIDSANIDEITEISKLGIICGVTTNPSLISKEGRDLQEVITEICELVDGPISGEVMSEDHEGMLSEAIELSKVHPNMVIKIPMSFEGLKTVNQLSKKGIKTNVTLIFTATQALLVARAGATFVSPFVGRLDDISQKGMELIEKISDIFSIHQLDTEIITASIRNPLHLVEAALAGSDIATVPYKVLKQCINHPLTEIGIERFKSDYEKSKQ